MTRPLLKQGASQVMARHFASLLHVGLLGVQSWNLVKIFYPKPDPSPFQKSRHDPIFSIPDETDRKQI